MSTASSTPPGSPGRRRAVLAGLAALVPLVPIIIALALSGGQGTAAVPTTNTQTIFNPVTVPHQSAQNLLIPPGSGTLVASLSRAVEMRSRPGGPPLGHLGLRTQFGSPQALMVARLSGSWLGVVSPQAGNNKLGWIPATAASLSRVNWRIEVNLGARQLTVLHAGRSVARYTIAVGASWAPTPTGHFAVTDRLHTGDPAGPYGCCILALSALAPHAIQGWSGGNRIAIHSTPETSSIGQAVSHGCMRLTIPEGQWLLNHIPIGTPTLIRT